MEILNYLPEQISSLISDRVIEPFSVFALANRRRKRVHSGNKEMGWRRKQDVGQEAKFGVRKM